MREMIKNQKIFISHNTLNKKNTYHIVKKTSFFTDKLHIFILDSDRYKGTDKKLQKLFVLC